MNNFINRNTPIPLPSAQGSDADAVAPAANPADKDYREKATKAAVQFEGFFISQMLHQMRSGTQEMAGEDSVFKDPVNKDMLDMADTMVADKMAGQRAFGIADAILRQLLPPPAATGAAGNNGLNSANAAGSAQAVNTAGAAAATAASPVASSTDAAAADAAAGENMPQKNNLVFKKNSA
jgi:flagellar protein FlgJ